MSAVQAAPDGSAPPPQVRDLLLTVCGVADTQARLARIAQPARDADIVAPVIVLGMAANAQFAFHELRLSLAGAVDDAWTMLARGLSHGGDA